MRRRRNGRFKGAVAYKPQDVPKLALEWRSRLQIDEQFQPDIELILRRPRDSFPHIRVQTFSASAYPRQRVRGWANARTRTIHIADTVETGLKYGDPRSRWDATHELAHVALGHRGNNLLMGSPYLVPEDRILESQVDEFVFEFLSPVFLAKRLSTVEEYERRFGLPHDKAIIRKHQVDEIIRRRTALESQSKNFSIKSQDRGTSAFRKAPSIIPEQFHLPFPELAERAPPRLDSIEGAMTSSNTAADTKRERPAKNEIVGVSQRTTDQLLLQEDKELIIALIRDSNKKVARYRKSAKSAVGIITITIGTLPMLTETVDGKIKICALAVSGLIGAALSFLQVLDRPIGLESRFEILAWKLLRDLAEERGITRKLGKFDIHYHQNKFIFRGVRSSD